MSSLCLSLIKSFISICRTHGPIYLTLRMYDGREEGCQRSRLEEDEE